jgi:opacity protein-like surface antigen
MNAKDSSVYARQREFFPCNAEGGFFRTSARRLALSLCLVGLALPALGGDAGDYSKSLVTTPPAEDEWQFSIAAYGWLPELSATTASGQDIDISLSDLLDNLGGVLMTELGVRKGKWALGTDLLYMDLTADGKDLVIDDIDLTAWVITPYLSYRALEGDWGNLDVLAGARYLYMKVGVNVVGPGGGSASDDQWDFIGGVRGEIKLKNSWYMPYYLDIGGGSSDLTWQAAAGIGYHFGENWDFLLIYRYLDFDIGGPVLDDLTVNGPLIGVRYKF